MPSNSSKASSKAPANHPVTVEEDEDLDDLDDVLEQFSKPQSKPAASTSAASKPQYGPPPPPSLDPSPTGDMAGDLGPDFAAELAANMESLMKELVGGDPAITADVNPEEEREMREAWEKLIIGDLEGDSMTTGMSKGLPEFKGTSKAGDKGKAPAAKGAPTEDAFQKTIKEAMDRLKTSDDSAKANTASSSDPLAQLLSQLGDVPAIDGDGEDEGDMKGLLESLMSQLMSKELLYEPLKELDEKYPEYFKNEGPKIPEADLDKYKKQHALVAQTVKIFENPAYSDDNSEQSGQVLKLMSEMQNLGSPPPEIMGELPPGWALGSDGMPNMAGGEGCVIT
ncbi:Peroxisome chaperone and import receptor [Tulasnella sp. JGI-2019a]|nr:Peroxisome chaperone and import receptor [Tulasnella sp. JGI-2019a]